jgi:hypothetical protein
MRSTDHRCKLVSSSDLEQDMPYIGLTLKIAKLLHDIVDLSVDVGQLTASALTE